MSVLAFDIGAGSGRALLADLEEGRLVYKEIHRFKNEPVKIGKRLHWDIYRLFYEVKEGIRKATALSSSIEGIGIDTWAVDFGLLGEDGELLRAPYHYRDTHTDGLMEDIHEKVLSRKDIFEATGIQFLPFNTIYQLAAMKQQKASHLDTAKDLLMIPDLLRYFLTGVKKSEFTNASTTQLFNPKTMSWDTKLLEALGIPENLFPEVVMPGTIVGELQQDICDELDIHPIPVIAVGEHDTASAVAGVPAMDPEFAYLSCGTWSLMGTEVKEPIMNKEALDRNFTNEGGVENSFRMLKNIMGLWILEECRREWQFEEGSADYSTLLDEADKAESFKRFIDPDDLIFLHPNNMPGKIKDYCSRTNQSVPQNRGEIVRCILESLALKYKYVFEGTQALSGSSFFGLHMVGGGIQNQMLCQFTSNALGKQVWAGPSEASAVGNIVMQFIALGKIKNLKEARLRTLKATKMDYYFPEHIKDWQTAYQIFCDKIGLISARDIL